MIPSLLPVREISPFEFLELYPPASMAPVKHLRLFARIVNSFKLTLITTPDN